MKMGGLARREERNGWLYARCRFWVCHVLSGTFFDKHRAVRFKKV
jgi:hypothetical protein